MAASINASTTAGVVTTADTSGVLNIQTAGTTAISISASQAVSFTNAPTVTGGTANGVAYLNGSKVLTTGSALVFDGTNLGIGETSPASPLHITSSIAPTSGSIVRIDGTATTTYSGTGYVGGQIRINFTNATSRYAGINFSNTGASSQDFFGAVQNASGYNDFVWQGFSGSYLERMRLDSSGNLGVGTTSPPNTAGYTTLALNNATNGGIVSLCTGGVQKGGLFNAGNNVYLDCNNSAGQFLIRNTATGATTTFGTGGVITSPATYSNTSGGSPNMFVQTDGTFYRGGVSALKYKQDVRDLELIDISKFRAVRYKSKCEMDDQTVDYFGLIADEVDAVGVKELVTYSDDGEVEGFKYDRLTVVLLKAIQEQQVLITQLQADVAALKGA